MKATGVIRAVDKLGRIVIPKEIRKNFRIREGDPIEIYTAREGEIVLKKYSPMGEMSDYAGTFAKTMSDITKMTVYISDRDKIIAAEGKHKKEYENKNISHQLETAMEARKIINTKVNSNRRIAVCDGEELVIKEQIIYPILSRGDVIGSVGIICDQNEEIKSEFEEKLINVAATFLGSLYG